MTTSTVIASEAKAIHSFLRGAMDCFAALAMKADRLRISRGAMRPKFCKKTLPSETGRREDWVRAAPRFACIDARRCAHEHTGSSGTLRLPRNGFTAYFVLPRYRLLPPSLTDHASIRLDRCSTTQLDASTGASAHTTSPYATARSSLRCRVLTHAVVTNQRFAPLIWMSGRNADCTDTRSGRTRQRENTKGCCVRRSRWA